MAHEAGVLFTSPEGSLLCPGGAPPRTAWGGVSRAEFRVPPSSHAFRDPHRAPLMCQASACRGRERDGWTLAPTGHGRPLGSRHVAEHLRHQRAAVEVGEGVLQVGRSGARATQPGRGWPRSEGVFLNGTSSTGLWGMGRSQFSQGLAQDGRQGAL